MVSIKPSPFIFVHIPKCAGTSIEWLLLAAANAQRRIRPPLPEERERFWLRCPWLVHSKLWQYENHFLLDSYYKFSFVRNPWERAVSHIEHLTPRFGKRLFRGLDFKECLRRYCAARGRAGPHDLGACQLDYLINADGKVVMDFIGRFENLNRDVKKIMTALGIKSFLHLPHKLNGNRARHYSQYYDKESVEWVRKRFARDIDYFGYEFEDTPPGAMGAGDAGHALPSPSIMTESR